MAQRKPKKPHRWPHVSRCIIVSERVGNLNVGTIYARKNGHWKIKGVAFGGVNIGDVRL